MQLYCTASDAYGNQFKSVTVTVTLTDVLEITRQPVSSLNVHCNGTASVSISATGKVPQYQWYFRKTGETYFSRWKGTRKPSISFPVDPTWDGANIRCVVTDDSGKSETSKQTTVKLIYNVDTNRYLAIETQPKSVSVNSGDSATFSVTLKDSSRYGYYSSTPAYYQWYYKKKSVSDFSIWKEYKSATINPPANSTWDGMQVYCQIKDAYGNIVNSTTTSVTLIPYEPGEFQITKQPQHHYFTKYDIWYDEDGYTYYVNANFSVAANGTDMTYQWYYCTSGQSNWIRLKNGTSSSISLSMRDYSNVTAVYCVVTNGDGEQLYSDLGTLTIDERW